MQKTDATKQLANLAKSAAEAATHHHIGLLLGLVNRLKEGLDSPNARERGPRHWGEMVRLDEFSLRALESARRLERILNARIGLPCCAAPHDAINAQHLAQHVELVHDCLCVTKDNAKRQGEFDDAELLATMAGISAVLSELVTPAQVAATMATPAGKLASKAA